MSADVTAGSAVVTWSAVLDDLERLALRAGAPTEAPDREVGGADLAALVAWAPPVGLGPLPPSLAERAAGVATTQRAALARVDAARLDARRHLDVVRTVEASHQPERPVYLDATG
ncbi:hypothetical protein F1C15_07780 [Frigoribacterium sp. NBH87]|uniref:hypothetical protein n=1 Tax=Frigoribacterium sp. NBH87 TaxID=2596916 RepID=UPI001624884D|nr:hypothetical protein [Frigoribacterium sp. NBH87]QNE43714.1 hypothetical protein F1C15_07780 [Frigoribacterium sp. NBH87]